MRVHEQASDEEEEKEMAMASVPVAAPSPPPAASSGQQQRLVVGYALTKKKVKSFLQPKLLALASHNVLTHGPEKRKQQAGC